MKTLLLVLTIIISPLSFSQTFQEVSNNEFNNWDSNTNPADWATLEDAVGPGNGIVIEETEDKQNGAASLKLITPEPSDFVDYSMVTLGGLNYDANVHRLVPTGEVYTSRPDSVWILYKYISPAQDQAGIGVTLSNSENEENILDVLYPIEEQEEWSIKGYKLSANYVSEATPDRIFVSFYSSASQERTPDSVLQIDGVYFNNPATFSVTSIKSNANLVVYPNPVQNERKLYFNTQYSLKGMNFHLVDVSGKKIGKYPLENENYVSLTSVSSGNYFWIVTNRMGAVQAKGKLTID